MAWSILYNNANVSSQTLAYTVPAGYEGRLSANFTNRSTSATATATLWVVPNGETVGNQHLKEPGTNLGLSGTPQASLERFFVAPAGAMVYVQASNSNVSCQVQGDVVAVDDSSTTDGTSSITYGTNWADSVFAETRLTKNIAGLVTLYASLSGSGTPSSNVLTVPSGYRPPKTLRGISGTCSVSGVTYPASFSLNASGQVSITAILPSSLGLSAVSGSAAYFVVSYYT